MNKTTYTLRRLLEEFMIKIPRIQRDYAQGRDNLQAKEVRKLFVESLWESVTKYQDAKNPNESLHLDFIYGRIENGVEDKRIFIPFDGQQRLTTLFLFYRYFYALYKYCVTNIRIPNTHYEPKDIELLMRFSYATRPSSESFCKKLCEEEILDEKGNLLDIYNLNWFDVSWYDDPTVKGMIQVLNDIHFHSPFRKDIKTCSMIDKTRLENITFTLADMGLLKMNDMNYISMNATGRPLTAWENFKASYLELRLEQSDEISKKFDTLWLDFFFEKSENKENFRDDAMLKMIQLYLFNLQRVNRFEQSNSKTLSDCSPAKTEPETFELDPPLESEAKFVSFSHYESIIKKHTLTPIFNFWDYLLKYKDCNTDLNMYKPVWERESSNSDIGILNVGSFSHKERVAFYACTLLFENPNILPEVLGEWMRYIWNILENSQVDSDETYLTYIRLVNQLHKLIFRNENPPSTKSDVWQKISEAAIPQTWAAQEQLGEEKEKCKWLINHENNEQLLHVWESHVLLKGKISYLFTNDGDKFSHIAENFRYINSFYDRVCRKQNDERAEVLIQVCLSFYRALSPENSEWMRYLIFPSSDNAWKNILYSRLWCLPEIKEVVLSQNIISTSLPSTLYRTNCHYIDVLAIVYKDVMKDNFILWYKDGQYYARPNKGAWRSSSKQLDAYSELQFLTQGVITPGECMRATYQIKKLESGSYCITQTNTGSVKIICAQCLKKTVGEKFEDKLGNLFLKADHC